METDEVRKQVSSGTNSNMSIISSEKNSRCSSIPARLTLSPQTRLKVFHEQQKKDIRRRCSVHDLIDLEDPQQVAEYASDVSKHIKSCDPPLLYGYMSPLQADINEKMRAILVDWLIDVHLKFKLLPETLFLTIEYID
jgi:cyclin B